MCDEKKKMLIGIPLILSAILCILYFVIDSFFVAHITLEKGRFYTINYKAQYKEAGYKAVFNGKDVTNDVLVEGKVNPKKIGNYKIVYTINHGLYRKRVVRNVYVRDIEKPKIVLDEHNNNNSNGNSSDDDIYVCPDKEFKANNYKAIDNYDGDITEKVRVLVHKNLVTYKVMDSYGNFNSITKNIKYEDNTIPVIELIGDSNYKTFVNEPYNEPGYKATDNCDGDITSNVIVTGGPNTEKVGKYEMLYTVTDKNNNKTEVKRIISVVPRSVNGTVYLTFDDGPQQGTTNIILDILKEEGVKATFFVTNKGPDSLIKREYDEGHTVALHTASHDYGTIYSSIDNYFADLDSVHNRVLNITGHDSRIIRFPGGSSNTISRRYCSGIMSQLTKEVLNRNYRYFDWNISSGDAGNTTDKNVIYNNVVSNLSKDRINVVLMHDIKPYTRDALRQIIRYGKENGFIFDKINDYTQMVTQRVNN